MGLQVSLAAATQHRTVFLCIFGALGAVPLASVRANSNPATAMANGELSLLAHHLCQALTQMQSLFAFTCTFRLRYISLSHMCAAVV